ncbi:hypothetical protein PENARI_c044G07541 [Penicillium arizonense]|uniref:Uncharacterized protein n=1 Tax=Penicillium arizonense TaxID=1835702 RepID=A0A1F5L2K3_PENAI|nr:hypothetical protein PENARI_c044G07541 [Penicillium arizonense]OGE47435.1 hypothetical protein PENARI_c044G07541 [Penicillium arizonense]
MQELRFTMFTTIGEDGKAVYKAVGEFPYLTDLKILMICIGRPEERVSKDPKLQSRYYGNIKVNARLVETLSSSHLPCNVLKWTSTPCFHADAGAFGWNM